MTQDRAWTFVVQAYILVSGHCAALDSCLILHLDCVTDHFCGIPLHDGNTILSKRRRFRPLDILGTD